MIKTITTILIVLFPILNIYGTIIPSISIGEFFLLLMLCFNFIVEKAKKFSFYKRYIHYIIVFFVLLLVSFFKGTFNTSIVIHRIFSFILYGIILVLGSSYFDVFQGIRYLKRITVLSSSFLIFQFIIHELFNITVVGIIPFLPLSNMTDTSHFVEHLHNLGRFSAFFDEPSHYAQFAGLGLVFYLFKLGEGNRKINLLHIFIIITAMFLSKSGNAILIILTLFIIYNARKMIVNFNKTYLIQLMLTILFLTYFVTTEYFSKILYRINEFSLDTPGQRVSGFIRVVKGYVVFSEFSALDKLFGITGYNISLYSEKDLEVFKLLSLLPEELVEYVNAIQFQLIYFGYTGLAFFLKFYYSLTKQTFYSGKVTVILLFMLSFVESIFNTATWSLYVIVAISLQITFLKKQNGAKII